MKRSFKYMARAVVALSMACGGSGDVTPVIKPENSLRIEGIVPSLSVGMTAQLSASLYDANGKLLSSPPAVWSSRNADIVSIGVSGTVTALNAGTATIDANWGGLTAVATVTVVAQTNPIRILTLGIRDTINAIVAQKLRVRAVDSTGAPLANAVLAVDATFPVGDPRFESVLTAYPDDAFPRTDALGVATIQIRMGFAAGTWYIRVFDRFRTTKDSVAIVVDPGLAAAIGIAPRDSAAFVDGGYQLGNRALDRGGNPLDDAVSFTVDSSIGVANVSATGRLSALAIGRARIVARVAATGITDTARLTVVPPGRLAGSAGDDLAVVNMDGSGFKRLVPNAGQYIFASWSPDGQSIVYNNGDIWNGRLFKSDLNGNVTRLSPATPMSSETWPRYSPDGQWIYFTGGQYPDFLDTYRMKADGTGPRVRVTPLRPYSTRFWKASPSPDGTSLVYSEAGYGIRTVNLSTGVASLVPTPSWAESPRYSPDGAWIAYSEEYIYAIQVVRPDGTGYRRLTGPSIRTDYWGHDWSPDGKWIVFVGNGLQIVRVSDGLILPLPFKTGMFEPSWHQ